VQLCAVSKYLPHCNSQHTRCNLKKSEGEEKLWSIALSDTDMGDDKVVAKSTQSEHEQKEKDLNQTSQ